SAAGQPSPRTCRQRHALIHLAPKSRGSTRRITHGHEEISGAPDPNSYRWAFVQNESPRPIREAANTAADIRRRVQYLYPHDPIQWHMHERYTETGAKA